LPTLRIDRTRIRQVVLNLINNARRFTERGEVSLTALVSGQDVIVSVRDTGPGIPADKLDLIFQEFYQVDDRLLKNKGGTGLGLAICKNFVDTHGGRIWAESELGVGSIFHFSLPLGNPYLAISQAPAIAFNPTLLARILVVGADEHVLAMLRSAISGYEFVAVEHPDHLTAMTALYHPRAVVMNVLPGDDPARMNAPDGLNIPVILCSLPSTLWLTRQLGIQNCLSKPVTRAMLEHELSRLPNARQILIVDDDMEFVQLVQRILQSVDAELEIRTAANGQEGLAALRAAPPDLALLDLTMPDIDGFSVIAEVKKDPRLECLPIVLLTATLTPESLLSFPSNRLVIEHNGEMNIVETLHLIKAALGQLETRYEETTDEVILKIGEETGEK